jgi:hypothetical protein
MKLKNSIFVVSPLLLTSCGSKNDEIIFSIGMTVFLMSVIAYLTHLALGKIGSLESLKNFVFKRPKTIKVLSFLLTVSGLVLFAFGVMQKGVNELFSFVGLSIAIIGALLPRSFNYQERKVNLKGISIFLIGLYVLLFLIYKGDTLFKIF